MESISVTAAARRDKAGKRKEAERVVVMMKAYYDYIRKNLKDIRKNKKYTNRLTRLESRRPPG